jgi:DNA-binding transcriptional MerR regulator
MAMLKTRDVAAFFGIRMITVRFWVLIGVLKATKIGRDLYYDPRDVEKLKAEGVSQEEYARKKKEYEERTGKKARLA